MMDENGKKQGKQRTKNIVIFILIIGAVLIGLVSYVFYHALPERILSMRQSGKTYDYHFAMIYSSDKDAIWESVYEGAKKTGEELGIYVEDFGNTVPGDYSVEELLEMAIAARVDGIIVEGMQSERMTELIDEADASGIAVVTMIRDVVNSKRKTFVGINTYALGELYGNQTVDDLMRRQEKGEKSWKVAVLMDASGMDTSYSLILSNIRETLHNFSKNVEIIDVNIAKDKDFESEEIIRNLVLDEASRPDIIICLDSVDTISSSQVITDYNLVGEITILGYYSQPEILDGIQKGIIKSSVDIDAEKAGKTCVEYLNKFIQKGYVSEYAAVETNLITQSNVEDYISEKTEEREQP